MGLKRCSGSVVALGPCEYDMHGTRYAHIDIERYDGRILRANNVLVLNRVGSLLCIGLEGEFHFDSAILKAGVIRQLFGIHRDDGRWAYDAMQVRILAAIWNIFQGVLLSFVVVGIPFVLIGLLQLVYSVVMPTRRSSQFFGSKGRLGTPQRRDGVIRI